MRYAVSVVSLRESKKPDFRLAMAAYAVLAVLAGFTIDGPLRVAVLLLLAALAVKTWIHTIRERQ